MNVYISHEYPTMGVLAHRAEVLPARPRVARPLEWPWKQARNYTRHGWFAWIWIYMIYHPYIIHISSIYLPSTYLDIPEISDMDLHMFLMFVPQIMIAQLRACEHLFALWTLSLEQDT